MVNWQIVLVVSYAVVVLLTLVRYFVISFGVGKVRFLTPMSPRLEGNELPTVSILVPAKDEEHGIEQCVRSLLAQDHLDFEILVVDDRSEDRTAQIVERLENENERLRLIRVRELPAGWTGKTHALDVCQKEAKGQWLLFIDADTRLHPCCLSVVLRDAIDHKVEMETLLPALDNVSFWERVVQPFAGICLIFFYPPPKVNSPAHPELGFANGQFILVRRDAYDAIGGHAAVRDKFVEDIHLGRRIRQMDLGLRLVLGPEILSVRMYGSFGDLIRGWSRIFYAAVDGKARKIFLLFLSICVFSVLSYTILIGVGTLLVAGYGSVFLKTIFAMGIVHQILQSAAMARLYSIVHSRPRDLLFRIFAVFVMLYILLRTIRMCWTHTVVWRGTNYGRELTERG